VLVFLLCGLWHGASWTFVVWGLYHGLFLMLERAGLAARVGVLPKPLRHAYALLVVTVGWAFFRADTLGSAVAMLAAMGGAGGASPAVYAPAWFWTTDVLLAIAAGAVGSTPVIQALAQRLASPAESSRALTLRWHGSIAALLALTTLLAVSVMLSAARSYNPFIYFRF
jgi:alginate O-acetyltransferase complex protein AlgI